MTVFLPVVKEYGKVISSLIMLIIKYMEEIKSKKRKRRLIKRENKKVALPEWIVNFHKIFHYYPLEGHQAFFEGYFQSCEQTGYQKGKEDEAKAYKDLLEWVKPIFKEWQDTGDKNEITTIVGILEWKLQREYNRGRLEADNPSAYKAEVPLPKTGENLQTNTDGRSCPSGENSKTIPRRRRNRKASKEKNTGQDQMA